MKVSIVTEGFQNTGYGHITRCLSLYQAFEEKYFDITFYVNGDDNAVNYLAESNHKIINWLTHPTKLFADINGSDILVIDSYHAGKEYYETLSKLCKTSLFIDDFLRLDYPPGIILNGTINAETFPYKKNPGCEYLLGAKYIPIRKDFWDLPQRKFNQNLFSVIITFGGQDIKNLTIPTIKSIQNNFPGLHKNVIVGSSDSNKKEFEKLKDELTDVYFSIDASRMKELMLSSDAAITAAGQTLYELAATSTPTIAVSVADNQKNNISEWKKAGFLIDTIYHGDSNYLKKINDQLNSLKSISTRKKIGAKGKTQIDGQGSRRVVKFLIDSFCKKELFYFRKAVLKDSDIVFSLSNDSSVREQSINKNPISLEEHEKWFSHKINDPDYLFLLAFNKDDNFIGQVRFQIEDNNSAVISISITNEFRGKGFARKMLTESCLRMLAQFNSINGVNAYILPKNNASIRSFLSAGFEYIEDTTINGEIFSKYFLPRTVK